MKKILTSLTALLIFSLNTAVFADTLTGQIVKSKDYQHHILESNGQLYELKFDRPIDLKANQKVVVEGSLVNDNKLLAKDAFVLAKITEQNGVIKAVS